MRLAHVTTVPISLAFLRGQLGYMKEHGFEVHVISSPGTPLEAFGAEQQVVTHAIEMPRAITPLRDLLALARMVRTLRRLRPAIVHAHTPKGGLLGMLGARLAGVPVRIYHMRGLPLVTATGYRRALLRWTERLACFAAHEVLCVSHSLRDVAIDERLCAPDKLVVLGAGSGNGVDAERRFVPRMPAAARAETRLRYGIPGDAVVIGFVGRLVRDKGLAELLSAWKAIAAELPHVHLLIVGMLEERDALPPETVALLTSDPRIHWKGEDWNMPPLYAAMDLVALPTYREGFPNVPLEAAAMELPTVASRVPGCVDAIEHDVTGLLVPVRDVAALARALRRYVLDPELRHAHGVAARERARRLFRPEDLWRSLCAEYGRLIAEAS